MPAPTPSITHWKATNTTQTRLFAMAIKVTARYGESSERMIQRFRRICSREGVLREFRRRRFHEKPSVARRRKAKEAARALKKAARRAARRRTSGGGVFL